MIAHLVDAALAVLVIEALVWLVLARLRARLGPARDWALNLLAGGCLLLALRLALAPVPWQCWAGALAAGGAAHAAQAALRWRRGA